jgi:hypothetical protein
MESTEQGRKFPKSCADLNPHEMCAVLAEWGKELETWDTKVQKELAKLHDAVCSLERQVYYGVAINKGMVCNQSGEIGGGPPTDPVGTPPKPPFK